MIDRAALGLRWRLQVASALSRAGHPVLPYGQVIDGPQVCVIAVLARSAVLRPELTVLADKLTHALNVDAEIHLSRHGRWLVAEIPWPDRRMIPADKMRSERLRLELGITPAGRRLAVDLADDTQSHILIAGKTGSGKSQLLRSIAVLLARANSPDALTMVMIDGRAHGHRQGAFTPLADLAHLAFAVATTREDVAGALDWVTRVRMKDDAAAPCVVLIDEPRWLRHDKHATALLTTVAEEGRKHRVHLVLAAQRVTTDSVARDITVEFGVRVAGRVRDWRESYAVVDTRAAEGLLGKGDMLVVRAGHDATRFQAALTSSADIAALPTKSAVAPPMTTAKEDDPELLAWIITEGRERTGTGSVATAEVIRRRVGCGTTEASRLRDLAEAVRSYLPTPEGSPGRQFGPAAAISR